MNDEVGMLSSSPKLDGTLIKIMLMVASIKY